MATSAQTWPESSTSMRFDAPAEQWVKALPLGNGTLGLMVHGGILEEHLQVNDGTAWSGSPISESSPPRVGSADAADAIERARQAIDGEDFEEAYRQLQRVQHRHSQSYLPFADVLVGISPSSGASPAGDDYWRSLDLSNGTHTVSYLADGHRVIRTTLVSRPHGVAMMRIQTENPAGLNVRVTVGSPLMVTAATDASDSRELLLRMPSRVSPPVDEFTEWIDYSTEPGSHLEGALIVGWSHDGEGTGEPMSAVTVRSATIVIATQTTFAGLAEMPEGTATSSADLARKRIAEALRVGFDAVAVAQRADHSQLFSRTLMTAGDGRHDGISLDRRIERGNADPDGPIARDPGLAATMFNFGRYLLICSSRPGGLPANLQGIWNDLLQPPWSSNYTTNINLEMNYWMAEVANLPELAEPLFDLIHALSRTGEETARRIYSAPGWVVHHNTDPWGYTQPVGWGRHDPRWAFWPMGAAWLARHLWEHILFGADDEFVRDRAWVPIRSACEFYLHWLVELPDGTLGTSPSTSPENIFATPAGTPGSADRSSTMDLTLIDDLFRFAVEIDARLGLDDALIPLIRAARTRIPTPGVARDGLIPEWRADRPQLDINHRHVSHLYFAFPGDRPLTPELAEAVSRSLDVRGDEATGWSLAWKVALRARLRQPERVDDLLRLVFRDMSVDRGDLIGGVYGNLMVAHPPFQIDGNLGFVAGMVECVLQSHMGVIELLPAVPPSIRSGTLRGIVARPGIDVDLEWSDGELVSALIGARDLAVTTVARWRGRDLPVELSPGEVLRLTAADFSA